jgi:hypothetical protein
MEKKNNITEGSNNNVVGIGLIALSAAILTASFTWLYINSK